MTAPDRFRIDSHKLNYHPERVGEWLTTGDTTPIYVEVSPVGVCNHRCTFCGVDFMGYENRRIATPVFERLLPEMAAAKVRSIMYAGEGEPLLHPDMDLIATLTKRAGIDVSFTTNGTMLKPALARSLLPVTSWIKVSFNAGTAATYAAIHRTKPADFDRVVDNLRQAVAIRRELGSACTLGMQALLLPENQAEMETLALLARDIGLDYLVVKPYSQHTQSITQTYKDVHYEGAEALAQRLAACNTDRFQVVFRLHTMRKWDEGKKPYPKCQALPFWSYIDARGRVWGCSIYLNDERFLYGDVHEQGFAEIWAGERRRASLDFVAHKLDISQCRLNCRMDEVNRYLHDLRNPPEHVNFI